MGNIHRLKWLDKEMKRKKYPNTDKLIDVFEISKRQALRDIEYMKNSLNAPISYSRKFGGYFYAEKFCQIPFEVLSQKEMKLIQNLLGKYKIKGDENVEKLEDVFSKLNYGNETFDIQKKKIEKAIKEKNKIFVVFRDKDDKCKKNIVIPKEILCLQEGNYFGCVEEMKVEKLKLDFVDIEILKIIPEVYNVDNPVVNSKNYLKKKYTCSVKIPGNLKGVKNAYEIFRQDDIVEIKFENSDKIISFLLSQNKEFQIIKPKWLREKLLDKLKIIYEKNVK